MIFAFEHLVDDSWENEYSSGEIDWKFVKSKSSEAFRKNVKAEVKAGKPVKQAVAIAYAVKRAAPKGKK